MPLVNTIATNVTTKIYDMCGNSVDADAIFMSQMQATLEHIMDTTGYTSQQILALAGRLNDSEEFKSQCVEHRRAAFKVVK